MKIYFFLKKQKLPYQIVIYENLVFEFEKSLKSIFDFLGKDNKDINETAHAHDVYGNRMKNQIQKTTGLYYDHKWMQKSFGVFTSLIFAPQFWLMNFFYKKSKKND